MGPQGALADSKEEARGGERERRELVKAHADEVADLQVLPPPFFTAAVFPPPAFLPPHPPSPAHSSCL